MVLTCLLAVEQPAMHERPDGLRCCCSCHCCFFYCSYLLVSTVSDGVVKKSEAKGHILLPLEAPVLI